MDFKKNFTELERRTWLSVKAVTNNFLGNTKSRNDKHLIDKMLQNLQKMKVNITAYREKWRYSEFGLCRKVSIWTQKDFLKVWYRKI